jgi:hypothetical protein
MCLLMYISAFEGTMDPFPLSTTALSYPIQSTKHFAIYLFDLQLPPIHHDLVQPSTATSSQRRSQSLALVLRRVTIFRQLPPIALCKCREHIEGPTISYGERLEWPLLRKKIERVFPRSSNPIMPCEWGYTVTKQDTEGHTWDVHYLEIKECMSAPSYMPLAPGAQPLVLIRER